MQRFTTQTLDSSNKMSASDFPIVYEVLVDVDEDIVGEFREWLTKHAQDVIALDDCRWQDTCEVFEREGDVEGKKLLTVLYRLQDREGMQQYLDVHAPRLRGDLPAHFAGKLSISRNIMRSVQTISKD